MASLQTSLVGLVQWLLGRACTGHTQSLSIVPRTGPLCLSALTARAHFFQLLQYKSGGPKWGPKAGLDGMAFSLPPSHTSPQPETHGRRGSSALVGLFLFTLIYLHQVPLSLTCHLD